MAFADSVIAWLLSFRGEARKLRAFLTVCCQAFTVSVPQPPDPVLGHISYTDPHTLKQA